MEEKKRKERERKEVKMAEVFLGKFNEVLSKWLDQKKLKKVV